MSRIDGLAGLLTKAVHDGIVLIVFVQVLSTVIYCVVSVHHSWLISVIIIVIYQTLLSSLGLADYILSDATGRLGFIAANREGICSCVGFLALYYIYIVYFARRQHHHNQYTMTATK